MPCAIDAEDQREEERRADGHRRALDPRRKLDRRKDRQHRQRRQQEAQVRPVVEDRVDEIGRDRRATANANNALRACGLPRNRQKPSIDNNKIGAVAISHSKYRAAFARDVGERKQFVGDP